MADDMYSAAWFRTIKPPAVHKKVAEENHIESLSCPVVISADDLRQLLQQAALKGG